ncbi:MFS transporter [Nocardioides perillae]|uniref:MFS family permease n=1 Tax=Nocardioides perillae TaxID=1119534 RepID=A0A7Y9RQL9_9ACTN|nr:MFS family permease [Nocardioides perillae]
MTSAPPEPFRLRSVALAAYGPSVAASVGHGAVLPVLALHARDLGASVAGAGLVVALLGLGAFATSLPAGALVARIGERRTLVVGGVVDAAAMAAAALTGSVVVLSAAVLASGAAWSAFLIARQGFVIDAVPDGSRARALAALGASHRVGVLVGPLIGAALIGVGGIRAAFWLAVAASLLAALVALAVPDLGSGSRAEQRASGHLRVRDVLREHRRVLVTLGSAVVVIGASRSVRSTLLPLWADQVGLSASTTSLVFAVAAAVDIALAWPGGWLLDTRGRAVVAVPVVATTALAGLLLPFTASAWSVAAVAVLLGAGNGLGSGIVMTLGADSAPVVGRAQFLGGWRLAGEAGGSGGPLLVSGLAALVPLAAVSVVLGVLALAGSWWVGRQTRVVDRRRAGAAAGG